METPKYQRILLKISGEALAGEARTGLNFQILNTVAQAIGDCVKAGAQVAMVVGAGNFWRGVRNGEGKIERTRSDYMGMLGTTMNALALCDVLEQHGVLAVVQNALDIQKVSEPYNRVNAVNHLKKGTGDLRRWQRLPVLLDGYRRGPAGRRDRGGRHPAGKEHRRRI